MTTEETTAAVLSPRDEKRAQRIAKNVKAFAAEHGGTADGVVEYVGKIATRIALVGADGQWGDQVAPSMAVAERAVELSGVTRHDSFEGELGLKVKTGEYEWKRMAGIQI
ncbi:hypothetical protein [Streptacidiphilus jiangxiensis]|uniref:Uncharacterized protein n=1 Tax=Streptacidiphilus jiangxiensis TaxID=235985 RepID=A0A1H7L5X3_STRJI|nr:hypothetical protein [Streptacidiphilus jiangxiensis]SEK94429.1 hypothetical protein SAMN05414137_104356 [Streptacidiphilus jiangxiensis]